VEYSARFWRPAWAEKDRAVSISRAFRAFSFVAAALALVACRPDYPKCKEDDHCKEKGEVCVEGVCKECTTDAQCKDGYQCKANACVQKPECTADAECKDGKRCRAQKCVPECTTDAECARGERCSPQQRCVPAPECTTDPDCPLGKKCEAERCVPLKEEPKPEPETKPADDAEARRRAELDRCEVTRVFFEFNEFGLSEAARAALDKNAECIKHKSLAITLGGHADERGTEEYNIVLAGKRANSVLKYLVGLGVAEKLLKTVSYGEEKPLAPGSGDEAWAKNRRVEFTPR
jgi:peptidoglycan-associated lipoprotein